MKKNILINTLYIYINIHTQHIVLILCMCVCVCVCVCIYIFQYYIIENKYTEYKQIIGKNIFLYYII